MSSFWKNFRKFQKIFHILLRIYFDILTHNCVQRSFTFTTCPGTHIGFLFMCGRSKRFCPSNTPITQGNSRCWWILLFKVVDVNYTMHISKNWRYDFATWQLCFQTFQMAFNSCTPLSWLLIRHPSEMLDPCFIHCHKPM